MALLAALEVQACLFPLPYLLQITALLLAVVVVVVVALVQITAIFMAVAAVAAELLMVLAVLAVAEQGRVQVQEERVEQPV
jgi:hypothetical protein